MLIKFFIFYFYNFHNFFQNKALFPDFRDFLRVFQLKLSPYMEWYKLRFVLEKKKNEQKFLFLA